MQPTSQPQRRPRLSTTQADVLVCLAKGMSNQEIAESLMFSPHTVASVLSRLMKRLGLRNRTELAILAIHWGLLTVEEAAQAIEERRRDD